MTLKFIGYTRQLAKRKRLLNFNLLFENEVNEFES